MVCLILMRGKGGSSMDVLELLFILAIALFVLSLVIEAIPSIIKLVLICAIIGLAIHFATVVLG